MQEVLRQMISYKDYSNEHLLRNYHSNEWILHVQGLMTHKSSKTDQSMVMNTIYNADDLHETINSHLSSYNDTRTKLFYSFLNHRGYNYGPYFRCLDVFHITANKCCSSFCLPELLSKDQLQDYYLHPTIADACLQTAICCIREDQNIRANGY